MWGPYDHPMHDGWAVGGWLMLLVMVLFVAMLAVTVFLLLRGSAGGTRQQAEGHRSSAAEQLLAERYARGELDDEEYRRRLDTLRQ